MHARCIELCERRSKNKTNCNGTIDPQYRQGAHSSSTRFWSVHPYLSFHRRTRSVPTGGVARLLTRVVSCMKINCATSRRTQIHTLESNPAALTVTIPSCNCQLSVVVGEHTGSLMLYTETERAVLETVLWNLETPIVLRDRKHRTAPGRR